MNRVFLDSDVILDVALDRNPFSIESKTTLSLVESGKAMGMISSHSVNNMYYILRKISTHERALDFLKKLLTLVKVVPIDHSILDRAMDSRFRDFEDAVQYFSAQDSHCGILVTRNVGDYALAEISVLTPPEFNRLYTGV